MAALDFPDAPTVGQVYDKWTWNGTQWVLTAGGAPPGGTWRRAIAGLVVPVSTVVYVPWDVEDSDNANMVTLGNPVVTIPRAGIWAISATAKVAAGPFAPRHFIFIEFAAGGWTGTALSYRGAGPNEDELSVTAVVRLNAAQTFRIAIFQNSAAAHTDTFTLNAHLVAEV